MANSAENLRLSVRRRLGENQSQGKKPSTVAELAEKMGAPYQTVANALDAGGNPTLSTVDKIARALNASPGELLGATDHGVEECVQRVSAAALRPGTNSVPWVDTPASGELRGDTDGARRGSEGSAERAEENPKPKGTPSTRRR